MEPVLALHVSRIARPHLLPPSVPPDYFVHHAESSTSPALLPPTSFSQLSLGGSLAALIRLSNPYTATKSCSLKVEVVTNTTRNTLVEAPVELQGQHSIDNIIQHEIKEPGMHNMIVTMTPPNQEPTRRSFTFTVHNPLSVKTKTHAVTDNITSAAIDAVYLEVQLTNLSPIPLTFTPITFLAAPDLSFESLNPSTDITLHKSETYQHLYLLTPNPETRAILMERSWAKGMMPLGRCDISWISPEGEKGRLQTSTLVRRMRDRQTTPHPHVQARMVISNQPQFKKGQPATVQLRLLLTRISNDTSEMTFHLIITLLGQPSILIQSSKRHTLQATVPEGVMEYLKEYEVAIVPREKGLQKLPGVSIVLFEPSREVSLELKEELGEIWVEE